LVRLLLYLIHLPPIVRRGINPLEYRATYIEMITFLSSSYVIHT
jgi:hypothetical protein